MIPKTIQLIFGTLRMHRVFGKLAVSSLLFCIEVAGYGAPILMKIFRTFFVENIMIIALHVGVISNSFHLKIRALMHPNIIDVIIVAGSSI